ncbi:hypothetical protein F5B21DRAFT_429916 [Xylaria acuta]|nr:hypothetical protein F5B21DRAFT_429916 [Xylaria acuta]
MYFRELVTLIYCMSLQQPAALTTKTRSYKYNRTRSSPSVRRWMRHQYHDLPTLFSSLAIHLCQSSEHPFHSVPIRFVDKDKQTEEKPGKHSLQCISSADLYNLVLGAWGAVMDISVFQP